MTTGRDISHMDLLAVRGGGAEARSDPIAVEEPLEIRAEGPGQSAVSIAVTMRTPVDARRSRRRGMAAPQRTASPERSRPRCSIRNTATLHRRAEEAARRWS
jgi:hypothetical protein